MSPTPATPEPLYEQKIGQVHRETDRLFSWLLLLQWALAVALASYGGSDVSRLALVCVGGAVVNATPLALIALRPGQPDTRMAVAFAQIGWSILLVEGTGGRFGTEFHFFGSIAFLAFYRDPMLLVLAIGTAAADAWSRQRFGPIGWMVFEGVVLVDAAVRSRREMRAIAEREASLAALRADIEAQVEEKTAELAASRAQYRALVEGSHAVPWEMDPRTLRFVYVSPQAEQLLGRAVPVGRRFVDAIHRDDRHAARDALVSLGGKSDRVEFECRVANGDGKWVDVRSRVRRSPSGTLIGISFDVTREKKLELELRQAQKLESVGRLAAGVAHEINTPIQFVGDSVYFLRDAFAQVLALLDRYRSVVRAAAPDELPALAAAESEADLDYVREQGPRAFERTLDGVGRVATIVRSMKEFAHPDRTERVPTDLNRGITSTLTIARNEYKYVADVETDLGDLPPVLCHPGDINQVVLNLLVNAAHAIADRGSERGRIGVRTRVDGSDVLIEVSDTGAGIGPELREKIFEPFFTTKPVGKGTGQGLAISRAVVVDKHGGELSFQSEPGVGTTFTVRLPIAGRARTRVTQAAA